MKTYYLVDPTAKYPTRYKNLKALMDTMPPGCTLVGEADVGQYKHLPIVKLFIKDLLSNASDRDIVQAKRILRRFIRAAIAQGYSFELLDKRGHSEYSSPSTNIDFLITYAWKMGEARLLAHHPNGVWNDWLLLDVREGSNVIQECSVNLETLVKHALEIRPKMLH